MKKVLICCLCLLLPALLSAGDQTNYSMPAWITGFEAEGSYSEASIETIYDKPIYQISFSPRLMRVLSSKSAVGLIGSAIYTEQDHISSSYGAMYNIIVYERTSISYFAYGAGPIITYYPSNINNKNVPYLEFYALYLYYNPFSVPDNIDVHGFDRIQFGLNIGLMRHLSEKLGFTISAGISYNDGSSEPSSDLELYPRIVLNPGDKPIGIELLPGRYSRHTIYLRVGLLTFL